MTKNLENLKIKVPFKLKGLIKCTPGFSSVQFSSVAQSCPTLSTHESQHARPPCPSPSPGVHSDSCPSSPWISLLKIIVWSHSHDSSWPWTGFDSSIHTFPKSSGTNKSWICIRVGFQYLDMSKMSCLLLISSWSSKHYRTKKSHSYMQYANRRLCV